ncbi:MAG: polysaccharide deacetylase family protein [Synergistaceae bacterium]|jgi:peptidoglycan/xylan/chitin deacetylase (PgdA/CDA1 family)|nr:polysaccharide deacetylase family protein [Synergistaceae bacterium]
MNCELAVKIDVDTLKGYLEGVPRLLELLGGRNIKASIFFSMGPDNSGRLLRRILPGGLIPRMLRARTPATGPLRALLYGKFPGAPMIVPSNPDILKRAEGEGHDCGIRCWDRAKWEDGLPAMSREEIRAEFARSIELFSGVTGREPVSSAAPGWRLSVDSLTVQDELGFAYCSDVRGAAPFLPRVGGVAFRTLQIPVTLPVPEEAWNASRDADAVRDEYLDLLEPGLNVCTLSAEMADDGLNGFFRRFLDCCVEGEIRFVTLRDAALRRGGEPALRVCDVETRLVPGRPAGVAVQRTG